MVFSRVTPLLARHRRTVLTAVGAVAALWVIVLAFNRWKPLPDGVSFRGPVHPASDVEFLYDLTYQVEDREVVRQAIFDRVLAMIDSAETFVVLDMFLFDDEHAGDRPFRPITAELTERLIARKRARPDVAITFITDPINNFYGAYTAAHLQRLRDAGIDVVVTRLTRLRDSNPFYSAAWRILPAWLGTGGPGLLPHPLSSRGRKVTLRSYLALLNFKANHRKVIVTEGECLVTSGNPHDASSFHANIGFVARGAVCQDVLDAERGVAAFSGTEMLAHRVRVPPTDAPDPNRRVAAQYITEGWIRTALRREIDRSGAEDAIDLAVFYLSDRGIVRALRRAARRGVAVRLILDPNKDAFGRQKGGVPNRQVAYELRDDVAVRWYDTHGEQFHTKLAVFTRADSVAVIGGSANYTRRNLGNFNLEADLRLRMGRDAPLARAVAEYYERIWSNIDGHFTLDLAAYLDRGLVKRVLYRVQEFTGFCTY
ncbi:MAG TPA: phospholipase D-like domain-containing protein [Gemmatimonadales bacterium]